jgi:hypothetical protein
MNFCAKCGRERSGDARYCGGCGTEFAADTAAAATPPTDDSADAGPQPPATADWAPPADATRVERQPDATMIDRPGGGADSARGATPTPTPATAEPDPFAAWFAPSPDPQAAPRTAPGGQRQAAEPWQSADTVYAGSGQLPPAYPPSPQPAPGYPPPRPPYGAQPPPPGGRRSSGGRKAAFILVVVLVMLAAGGGAYALVSRSGKHDTAQPPASPTAATPAKPTAASSASASTSPSGGTSPSASASASTSPTSGLVSVGPGVASGATESAVEATLNLNFKAINAHDYAEYQSARNPQEQAAESQSAFASGYGSTSDSGITLTSLASAANGDEDATVTFTSHQAANASVDGSTCNDWKLTYYLVPQGTGYLIGPSPSGYQPTHSDC